MLISIISCNNSLQSINFIVTTCSHTKIKSTVKIFIMGGHKKQGPFDLNYFVKGALAGGICCSLTHGALTPVDVVKTRIQLEPKTYSGGMVSAARKIIGAEGVGALATGFGATAVGYFVQGWFKFGGVEFFKVQSVNFFGERDAYKYRIPIYLGAAAGAEFIADIFLCPLEVVLFNIGYSHQMRLEPFLCPQSYGCNAKDL